MCGARVETECQLLPSRHQQSHTAAGATHLQLARTDINIHSGALAEPRRIVAEVWYFSGRWHDDLLGHDVAMCLL